MIPNTQEQLLGVSRDIGLAQRFSDMGLSVRVKEVRMDFALEANPEGDCLHLEDEEEGFWSVTE